MKLTQLAAKPQLLPILLDDEEIITRYGDKLEFYIWDRQTMDIFVKLATLDYKEFDKIAQLVKDMILDETGQPVIKDDLVLPTDIMMKAIQKVVTVLGELTSPTTEKSTAD
jgi:hypothetical protein